MRRPPLKEGEEVEELAILPLYNEEVRSAATGAHTNLECQHAPVIDLEGEVAPVDLL